MRSANEILSIKCSGLEGATQEMRKLALEETAQFIKNYCNIDSIPSKMNFIWANIAYDLMKGAYISPESSIECDIKPCEVNSVSAGDMSVSRGSDTIAHRVNLDDLVLNYKDQLNKFRRVDWGCNRFSGFGGW